MQRLDWEVKKTVNREEELGNWMRVYGNEVESIVNFEQSVEYLEVKGSMHSDCDKHRSDRSLPSGIHRSTGEQTQHQWL